MNRLALRQLLRGLALGAAPLVVAGCPTTSAVTEGGYCGDQPRNEYLPVPDAGAWAAVPKGQYLPEETCIVGCGWQFDAGLVETYAPGYGADDLGLTPDGTALHQCRVTDGPDGGTALLCQYFVSRHCYYPPTGGRAPALRASGFGPRDATLGAWLSAQARFEAASVPTFARLARELAHHHAPASLVAAALAAERDEVRHARMMLSLARRHAPDQPAAVEVPGAPEEVGIAAAPPATEPALPARPLREVAIENAVEGCVHETWSAAVTWHQAEAAEDRALRRAARAIAEDETRHAELAWAVDRWARSRLPAPDAAAVADLRRAEIAALSRTLTTSPDPPPALSRPAGLPSRAGTLHLVAGLRRSLWA